MRVGSCAISTMFAGGLSSPSPLLQAAISSSTMQHKINHF
jgi:hypothetical protein